MDNSRNAIHAIKGYFYQFDKTILELLQGAEDDEIYIEGVEDIDLKNANDNTAIQCKYYEDTEYNPSVIAKPIRLMLKDFAYRVFNKKETYKYILYGYYATGHHKLSLPLTVEYLKDNFLIYHEFEKKGEDKVKRTIETHADLGLNDCHLSSFIELLTIDINAQSYDEQLKSIFKIISRVFSCSAFEAEYYYYNNAISVIKEYSVLKGLDNRKITPLEFKKKIDNKKILFGIWFSIFRTEQEYCSKLRNKYFPSVFNTNNYDRFFLFEDNGYELHELVDLVALILKRWASTNIKKMKEDRFSPYFYIHGLSSSDLLELKQSLSMAGYPPMDGYDFFGASFNCESIMRDINDISFYKIRFINDIENIDEILSRSTKRKEVYQFYVNEPFY
ncbi:hypothetical protein C4P28_004381, partial [Escherichia coli]|nr:hypothetical protein [Escherichia coli]